jgi:hypothetical protein
VSDCFASRVAALLRELQALFPLPSQPGFCYLVACAARGQKFCNCPPKFPGNDRVPNAGGGAIQTPPAASRPFPGILGSELEMLLPRAEVRSRTEPNGSDAVKDCGVLPAGVKRKRAL